MSAVVNVVGVFCEDIREEKSGQDTIIGVMPDNFAVPHIPGTLARLGVYVRMHFDIQSTAKQFSLRLVMPNAQDITLGKSDDTIIAQALKDAQKSNLPFAGVVLRAVFGPVQISTHGLIKAIVVIDGVDYLCAVLNIIPTASIASAPPPAQSSSVP